MQTVRLMWFEVGNGELATMAQRDFEEAQRVVNERGVPCKVKVEIEIFPPTREMTMAGQVAFKSNLVQPARKSIKLYTELDHDGHIIDSQHQAAHIRQEKLGLKDPVSGTGAANSVPFTTPNQKAGT